MQDAYPTTLTGSVRDDIVFIDPVIGVGEIAISDHRSSQPTFDEFLRVASECHVAGLMTGKAGVLHLHVGDGARGLEFLREALRTTELPARVFQPTHVNRRKALFKEALALAFLGEVPGPRTLAGGALIVAAAVVATRQSTRATVGSPRWPR